MSEPLHSKIRVCLMITELVPAGAERVVYELATRLNRDEFEVEVLAFRSGAIADELKLAGVKVHVLGVKNKLGMLLNLVWLFRLRKILRDGKFDIIHTHLFHADLAGRLAKPRNAKLIYSLHTTEKRFKPWRYIHMRLLRKKCTRIVAVSNDVKQYHKSHTHLRDEDYQVIHNGIDTDKFSPDENARREVRAELGIADDELVFVFAGRLTHQKGVDVLLDAFEIAHEKLEGYNLLIAGQGPQEKMLRDRLGQCCFAENAKYLGFRSDIQRIYQAGDILVMPSRWESFGLCAAEAMAIGMTVVATRVEGLGEIIVDGQTGLLVEPENPNAFADAIIRVANDVHLRKLLGHAGLKHVRDNFSVEQMVASHEKLYHEIAEM